MTLDISSLGAGDWNPSDQITELERRSAAISAAAANLRQSANNLQQRTSTLTQQPQYDVRLGPAVIEPPRFNVSLGPATLEPAESKSAVPILLLGVSLLAAVLVFSGTLRLRG
jgi:hypothetical protein